MMVRCISLRKAAQILFLFTCALCMNVFYSLIVAETRHERRPEETSLRGQYTNAQNGVDILRKDDKNSTGVNAKFLNVRERRSQEASLLAGKEDGSLRHLQQESLPSSLSSTSPATELSDIYISVKTSKKFHESRLSILLDTWVVMAREQTYFFTDADDDYLKNRTLRNHVINTNCSALHTRNALCCKMSVEYDYYIASGKKWFCHVDDDTYVNVPELLKLLQNYNSSGDWYLGKPSIKYPLEVQDINNPPMRTSFWFATGGAGFCLSHGLALKMMAYTAGGKLKTSCDRIRLPDDVTIGFIIHYYVHKTLTVIPFFHSHLEGLWKVKERDLNKHITLSYGQEEYKMNAVHLRGTFNNTYDPTRFRSIHCHLYPYLVGCPGATNSTI